MNMGIFEHRLHNASVSFGLSLAAGLIIAIVIFILYAISLYNLHNSVNTNTESCKVTGMVPNTDSNSVRLTTSCSWGKQVTELGQNASFEYLTTGPETATCYHRVINGTVVSGCKLPDKNK